MVRIISGSAKGTRLSVPKYNTRPTLDQVKEAVFSKLEHEVDLCGAMVLDLFAGSGSLGLESLSRGAAKARFVDSSKQSISIIRENIKKCGFNQGMTKEATVTLAKVEPWLKHQRTGPTRYDLIFLDPPYGYSEARLELVASNLCYLIAPGGLVVWEMAQQNTLRLDLYLEQRAELLKGQTRVGFYQGKT